MGIGVQATRQGKLALGKVPNGFGVFDSRSLHCLVGVVARLLCAVLELLMSPE